MATVPTAAQLNLGYNVKTTKDTTPTTGPNVELAGAASRIATDQQKIVTDAGLKLSSDFSAVQDKIDLRTDNINRTREFNTYFDGMSKEFQTLMDGDVADPEALNAFSLKLQTTTEEALNNHNGSAGSRNKMAIRLENQRAKFSAQAKSSVDTAQQVIVDKAFSESIAQTVSKVATGEIDLATALLEVDGLGEEYSEVASDTATFNQVEAAQQMVILGSIQRLVDLGNSDEAEAMINSNPEVIQTLSPPAVAKMIRSIEVQKIQKAKLIEEKQLKQDDILKAAGVTDPKNLPSELRMLYYTGQMGTPDKDNRTPQMKNAAALAKLEMQYGKTSAQFKNLAQLVHKQEKLQKTDIEKKFDALDILEKNGEGDSQEARVIRNQINLDDPVFVANKKKEEDFPAAQDSILDLERTTNLVTTAIDDALILISGVDDTGDRKKTIDKALKAISLGEEGGWGTGNLGKISSFFSGTSVAAQLEGVLTPVTSNIVLETMSKMRAQSSSGATGLGAMNNEERKMLENAAGSLDTRKPIQLIKTLKSMRESFPAVLKRQQSKFTKGFSSILGGEPEIPDASKVEVPKTPRGQEDGQTTKPGVINLSTYGDGVNPAPKPTEVLTPAKTEVKTPAKTEVKPATVTKKNIAPKVISKTTKTKTAPNQEIITNLTKLDKSSHKKVVNGILDLAEGKFVSSITDGGRIANKLWNEIENEFKKNPNDEDLKALLDKYNLSYKMKNK
tara:strand:- start:4168 stop:6360 length:2193 start_codon:yes stop_codon:yes gene_type:complete